MANLVEPIWTSDTEGCMFSMSGVRYLASCPKPCPESCQDIPDFSLFTVFPDPPVRKHGKRVSKEWVKENLEKCREDDVFDDVFLANIIFYDALMTGPPRLRSKGEAILQRSGMNTRHFADKDHDLVPGPHILWNQKLWQVCKLVEDSYETCMVALKPQKSLLGPFERLSIMGKESNVLSFAIPSRLKYTLLDNELPLAGKRILIKDNIHLNGIKTSNGNRAFYDTYPAATKTATSIQDLIDQGAVVIGKTKTSSFENWEEPIQYTDYPAPWNPRADRYQSPGSTSSGSASAIAAYEWLDIAIGTDTLGGVTRPAHWCGCFGLRPSIGAISAEGIEPCVNPWDIPGILARDLQDCKEFAKQWLNLDSEKFNNAPKDFSSIIWPVDFWAGFNDTERNKARDFAKKMADELKVRIEEISFKNYWSTHGPAGFRKYPLDKFMGETTRAIAYDKYKNSEDFRTRYKDQNGREPYTSKPNERIWSIGKQTSADDRMTASQRIDIYKSWFKEHVLTERNKSAIIVLPLDSAGPRYRDDCPDTSDESSSDESSSEESCHKHSSSDESSSEDTCHKHSSSDEPIHDDSGHDDPSYEKVPSVDTSIYTPYVSAPFIGSPFIGAPDLRAPYIGAPNINIFNINTAYINTSNNDSSFDNYLGDQPYISSRPRYGPGYPDYSERPADRCPRVRRQVARLEFRRSEVRVPEVQCTEVGCTKDNPKKHNHDHMDKQQKEKQAKEKQAKDDRPNVRRLHQSGINALTLGPVMESPVLAVPIGQTVYKSRVNQLEELSPFAVALMGPPGTDIRLIRKAMKVMERWEMPTKVETGKFMYST
ncbi:hypothetical protein THARTR1_01256 [Trichoderma harzianum]|uniref:Amidase domain-containing protein n=1 Tax=Trichoderma harzianum TaxID=5544 RepID=A0A2K0UML5_TRIHA|nr:hypothetical protein THARTR1_01256 [Trichoderma harzianum]